jgi:hypothetical protein
VRFTSLVLAGAGLASVLSGCRALDRDRYRALMLEAGTQDIAMQDAAAESGPCVASTDGGVVEGGCALVTFPDRPAGATDLGQDAGVRVFAMRRASFGFATTNWNQYGFDRDQFCTHNPDSPMEGCRPLRGAPMPVEDGLNGRDNSLGANLGPLFTGVDFNESELNSSIGDGVRTLGVRVVSYGGANDAQVVVEWFPIQHGRASDGTATLRWDGTDVWSIDARLAYDPGSPGTVLIRSNSGYTNCGTLVARLPARVPIRMAATRRTVRLTLTNAVMVGPIAADGSSLGPIEFSAAWPLFDARADLGVLGLCPPTGDAGSSPNWDLALSILNAAADLLSTGESSPAVECDAISAGFHMEFAPITLGADEMSPVVPEDLCGR